MIGAFCRVCGCTDDNCSQCIERTGQACYWAEDDLCSACVGLSKLVKVVVPWHFPEDPERKYNLDFEMWVVVGQEEPAIRDRIKENFIAIAWDDAEYTGYTITYLPDPEPGPQDPEDDSHPFEELT